MLASSPVAQFGAGMLADDAGQAAVDAWAVRSPGASMGGTSRSTSTSSTGSTAGLWPCPNPMASPSTRLEAVRTIGGSGAPVIGFGATAVMPGTGRELDKTVDAVTALAEAALG